jgi:hypothetical protein
MLPVSRLFSHCCLLTTLFILVTASGPLTLAEPVPLKRIVELALRNAPTLLIARRETSTCLRWRLVPGLERPTGIR